MGQKIQVPAQKMDAAAMAFRYKDSILPGAEGVNQNLYVL